MTVRGGLQSKRRRDNVANVTAFLIVLVFALLVLFPLWWILRSSLMTNPEIGTLNLLPNRWLVGNYPEALKIFTFFRFFGNTMTIAVPCVVFGTVTAVLCGYSFARLYFRGRSFVFGLCIASLLLPPVVTLIPLYVGWIRILGLGGTYWPLILPYLTAARVQHLF